MEKNYTIDNIDSIAEELITMAQGKILLFEGSMGVGKTTLIKALARELGVQEAVNSPTFSLVNEYQTATGEPVYHFDFYRLNKEEEALDFGIEEYFDSGAYCLIEWPDKIKNLLPLEAVRVLLTENPDHSRHIQVVKNE